MSRESSKQNLSARLFLIGRNRTPFDSSTVTKTIERIGFHLGDGSIGMRF
jgi:hypothetical protein